MHHRRIPLIMCAALGATSGAAHAQATPAAPSPAHIACGSRVVVPGAFAITGHARNWICARITAAPDAAADAGTACLTVDPE